jgi:cytochrome c oxidase cbb3-type subunit III
MGTAIGIWIDGRGARVDTRGLVMLRRSIVRSLGAPTTRWSARALLGSGFVGALVAACSGGHGSKGDEARGGAAGHAARGAAPVASARPKATSTVAGWGPAPAVKLVDLVTQSADDPRVAAGANAYAKYCALCHGDNARGYAADHAPSLVTTTFLESASDDFLSRSIRGGRPKTAMAGYGRDRGGPLSDLEITNVIAFLRAQGPKLKALDERASQGNAAEGQALYDGACKQCHGTPEFRGDVVHLGNPAFLATASDAFLRYAITNGRPGTPMVPFGDRLDEHKIDDLVAMLRSWGPSTPPAAAVASTNAPPALPLALGPVVINPKGGAPAFKLREDRFVPIDQVKKALDAKKKLVIIDARASSDYLQVHIPGSISIPYYELASLGALPKDDTWILAYCACPHHASGVVVDELKKRGFAHTAILDEGILEWDKRKYPVVRQGAPAPTAPAPASSGRR